MLPSISFRLSTYTTLALACAGLGYAESAMFPEVGVFALVVIVALVVIYRLETRVRLLSLEEANRLGAGIAIVALLWAGFRVAREVNSGEFAALGWPVFFVALTAPLLMAAVCAKLLRREKHAGDYWFMHAAGLAAIVLAGAMAEQAGLAVLTAAYAVSAVWSMSQFFLARSNGAVPIIPAWKTSPTANASGRSVQSIAAGPRADWRSGLLQTLVWCGVAAAFAIPIYLVTPRSTFGKLDFGQSRIEIGYAADQMIDLTQTGDLRANPETAFEVTALDHVGQPKEDLSLEQRWRGAILLTYTKGTWRPDSQIPLPTRPTPKASVPWTPPNFGETGYRLTFTVPTKLRSLFLADPVVWSENERASVADLRSSGPPRAWSAMNNGSVFGRTSEFPKIDGELRYVQYTKALPETDLSPPYPGSGDVQRALATNSIASVKEYAERALAEMVAAGRVPAGALKRDQVRLFPAPQYHEAIARAFREYLSERADLVYTTELKRVNKSVDPIEDFLFYSKVGHCERFATALVLMLRSEGIPAVMVLGFKGCEHLGEGKYAVRQDHAHAWAEALITRPNFNEPGRDWHWLTLDPAPVQSAESGAGGQNESVIERSRAALERYMFHYTPEQREQAIQAAVDLATKIEFISGISLLLFAIIAIRIAYQRLSRRPSSPSPHTAKWFDRMLKLLAKHGFAPVPGETAREFAIATAATLGQSPATADQAHVPIEWVDAYYANRFGGTTIANSRLTKLDAELDSLKQALERGNAI